MKNEHKSHSTRSNFKLPDDYFNQLEDEVMIKLITYSFPKKSGFSVPPLYFTKATEPVCEKLFGSEKRHGFVVPAGYFNRTEIPTEIQEENTVGKTKVIPLKNFFLKQFAPIAVAASLALLLFFNYDRVGTNLNNIATADIEQWINEDLISLNDSEILEVFADVELTEEQYFDDEEVLEYLGNTNVELILLDEPVDE
ncbi:hypothetical protein MWU59_05225 [Flavobacteriaceae bacterium F08102]|nr:hypothetical protein [Flavobacteriaceae bacterium F08102]